VKSIVTVGAVVAMAITAGALEIDGVAAKVGTDTILRSEVLGELRRMGEMDGARYDEVRNDMIERKLILQAASESKMTMQEWVIDNRIREIITRGFSGDRNKLVEMLGKQKMSFPEWRAKLKEDMIISAMRYNVVDKNVSASPAAMRKEYEEHPDRYAKDRKVTISVIMLKPEESSRREDILRSLPEKSFEDLGGMKYENVNPDELFKPDLVKEIDALAKGKVSRWVELEGWSYLIRKDSETVGKKLAFDEAYDEIEAAVKESEQKRLYKEWVDRLRDETYIKIF